MKSPSFICFGHRGACGYEPENTLRSIRRALDLGANGIEIDVHLADGHLVVIHDDTLDRTTNGTGPVSGKSFAQLRSLNAGQGERIPTLAEVFDTVNRRALINVELKGPGTAAPVARLVQYYVQSDGWSYEDFVVSSFDHAQIQAAKQLQPEIRIGALIEKAPRDIVAFAQSLNLWSIHSSRRCVSAKLVAQAHERGRKVFVYTINRPSELTALLKLGVDGVFTNYPDLMLALLRPKQDL